MAETSVQDERKRLRLEAWRRRQQQTAPTVKVSLSLSVPAKKDTKQKRFIVATKKNKSAVNPFGDDQDDVKEVERKDDGKRKVTRAMGFDLDDDEDDGTTGVNDDTWGVGDDERGVRPLPPQPPVVANQEEATLPSRKRRKVSRWDNAPNPNQSSTTILDTNLDDALDKFMEKLQAGAMGNVVTQETIDETTLSIDVGGSMMRVPSLAIQPKPVTPVSGGAITAEELTQMKTIKPIKPKKEPTEALYSPNDWESDAQGGNESASEVCY